MTLFEKATRSIDHHCLGANDSKKFKKVSGVLFALIIAYLKVRNSMNG
jgi:hypothetical protein